MALLKVHPRMLEVAGTLVTASANQTIPHATWTELTWDLEEYDAGGWHDPGRLTVPPGVAFARASAGFRWGANSLTGVIQCRIIKNGSTFAGQPQQAYAPSGNDTQFLVSGILPVVPGDCFTAEVRQTSGADYDLEKSANASWLAIEALG